jgi:cytochrome c oxidase subunit 3
MNTDNSSSPVHDAHAAPHAHHFDSANHQYSAAKEGIWLFMTTEILMFGGLFVAYIIFRNLYPEVFAEGAAYLNWKLGATNTVVLIFSSLTMALAIHYIQLGDRAMSKRMLLITMACALCFLVIKFFEYKVKFEHGTLPGAFFHEKEFTNPNLPLFFGMYFVMTGLHGLHVIIGFGLMVWLYRKVDKGELGPENYTAMEGVGMFWHVVDLIWIYLFPLYYLVG